MVSRFPLFSFRVTPRNCRICLAALDMYRRVDRRHPSVCGSVRESIANARADHVQYGSSAPCCLSYPTSVFLEDALAFLLVHDDTNPEVPVLKREDERRDAESLVAALGDFNATRRRVCRERRLQGGEVPAQPTEADREERSYREKRDAIFREIVGEPENLGIWGHPVDESAGHHDLRKRAKSTNFAAHPFQSLRVKLDDTDADQVKKATGDLGNAGYWRHKSG